MPINLDQLDDILRGQLDKIAKPKRGLDIFAGTDYPRDWAGFIGQESAKEQLQVAVASAKARNVRLDHALLSSGQHGVGKTTLATLLAYAAGVGLVQAAGPMTQDEFSELVLDMEDRDILFIDELHKMVAGNRTRADWLLPWMTEGKLYTKRGAKPTPDVTLVGATTDEGVLPDTLLSRFMLTPDLTAYTAAEAALIAENLAVRMDVQIRDRVVAECIATAADGNPRMMRKILSAIRDLQHRWPESHPNLAKAYAYAGVSADGLTLVARDMLLVLATSLDFTASIETIASRLNEPGPLKHHERQLLQRGLINITGRGRKLTDAGLRRAHAEAQNRTSAA